MTQEGFKNYVFTVYINKQFNREEQIVYFIYVGTFVALYLKSMQVSIIHTRHTTYVCNIFIYVAAYLK